MPRIANQGPKDDPSSPERHPAFGALLATVNSRENSDAAEDLRQLPFALPFLPAKSGIVRAVVLLRIFASAAGGSPFHSTLAILKEAAQLTKLDAPAHRPQPDHTDAKNRAWPYTGLRGCAT